MNTITDNRLRSFLVNDDFINYVLNPNLILKEMLEDFINSHPEDIPILKEARQILLGELNINELSTQNVLGLEYAIFEKCGLESQ